MHFHRWVPMFAKAEMYIAICVLNFLYCLFFRVKKGVCYHLFTQYHWDNFADYTLPEILRTPLDALGLQIKVGNN